jgi:hypothetical protein
MTSCGTPQNAAGPSGPPSAAPVSFADFVAGVQRARYADYAGRPDTRVQDEPAFEEMRRYLLDRYGTARVEHSYVLAGTTVDCLPSAGSASPGSVCPQGTVPVRRITLVELVRFPTLRSFLGKAPDGGGLPPVPPS